ncbi:putative lipoprotein [Streptomyces ipomoeae 91-03]|uniref:Putative lipoprotein n=1 Tax=Streptomyces ipomoeae 91-03 TaxID=698759 RepID=L1L5P7_9ACTN|nr:putative lipoprotein [Streptomyces ipomoeae 91-03]
MRVFDEGNAKAAARGPGAAAFSAVAAGCVHREVRAAVLTDGRLLG